MQFIARGLTALLAALLVLGGCTAQGNDTAQRRGDRPQTSAKAPDNPKPCSLDGVGEAPRVSDMDPGEKCFTSLLSLKRVDHDAYELGTNCLIVASKDDEHPITVRRLSTDNYSVTLTPDQDATVANSIDCEGSSGDTVKVSVSIAH